ncbi:Major facilitator superfamily domain, partial [Trinorchestia longiramus]
AGIAGLMFLVVVLYFPAVPPYPPSPSSVAERLDYFSGIKTMLKEPQMVLILVTYSFSVGIPIVWVAVMNFSLCCIGIHQEESMYVALASILTSCLTAFIAARITDLIFGHLKRTIIVLLTLASFCFFWFLLISANAIKPHMVCVAAQVYLSVVGGVSLQYATVPLLTELAVEIAYPCPESVVGVLIIGSFNIVAAAFLLLLIIPSDCYMWVNGILVACTSLTIIPLFFVKETYKRRATD